MEGGVRVAVAAPGRFLIVVTALALMACAGAAKKPAIPDHHVVRAGETLYSTPAPAVAAARAPSPRASPEDPAHRSPPWVWPVQGGRVIGTITQPSGGLGLRIDGELKQPVFAAADGKIVYTGSGLRGYGQLIIITHERGWLSAYGHNALVHVREGETVRAGQAIAAMGLGPGQQAMLYFEIRLDGRPLDPLKQLRPR